MDDDTSNELADLYETLRHQYETLRGISIGVEALVKTVLDFQEPAKSYSEYIEVARQSELTQRIDLLIAAVRSKASGLRRGARLDPGPVN
jgi:hypothetical protein